MRIILFTGKGGVGKTSVAAATALRSAELGHKTIALSTDTAHSLSDCFDISLGNEPQLIMPNLWGQETELAQTMQRYWGTVQDYLSALLAWRGMDEIAAEEVAIIPGMEELANLLYILYYQEGGQYDTIIVDCAPTGETLRLLSFPEVLQWWMLKMFHVGRKVAGVVHPMVRAMMNMPLPDDKVFNSVEGLYDEIKSMHTLLTDASKTSIRLVVNPEKMVIKEAQRTFTYLNLFGYHIDLIICNRLIPKQVRANYFQAWKHSQKKYYQMISEGFSPLPIMDIPLMEQEIVGIPMLRAMAEALYNEADPTTIFFQGKAQDIQKEDKHYILSLTLPITGNEKISVVQSDDELTIQVADFRRNIILPSILHGATVGEAKLEKGKLRVKFNPKKTESNK
ncbi:MAG: ArsA family ATPase [Dehalococcoidales bacterium]|nr:ArsA family ATPase [Dehalococcoidales bacterium]